MDPVLITHDEDIRVERRMVLNINFLNSTSVRVMHYARACMYYCFYTVITIHYIL